MWANEELSKELFESSGWLDPMADGRRATPSSPYYSLGFILRKLPRSWFDKEADDATVRVLYNTGGLLVSQWIVKYAPMANLEEVIGDLAYGADTPEDAAAKLAIELFKQGILTSPNQALKTEEKL